jgi:hypothetical protein
VIIKILQSIFALVVIVVGWFIIAIILLSIGDHFHMKWLNNTSVSLAGLFVGIDWGRTASRYIWGE